MQRATLGRTDDLPALTRLVNWAGMLGSRVLLSSATLPPALIESLFDAYLAGRKIFQKVVGESNTVVNICCAWFDEYKVKTNSCSDLTNFTAFHQQFVKERVEKLKQLKPLRVAELLNVKPASQERKVVIETLAEVVFPEFMHLHTLHQQKHPLSQKSISIGLMRMANINPLVALSKALFKFKPPPNFRIHYCIYHSQYPLIMRSIMERHLDSLLKRHYPEKIWENKIIQYKLSNYPEDNHIFLVLGSPVTEVGRDHDYDWAIAEPSSMRSLIQLGGRIQRHRQQYPVEPNFLILNQNFRSMIGWQTVYCKPGFEKEAKFLLRDHDLNKILASEQLQNVNAVPRILESKESNLASSFIDLEHKHIRAILFGEERTYHDYFAARWWESPPIDWCAQLQQATPFRPHQPDELFVLSFEEEGDAPKFYNIINDIKKDQDTQFTKEILSTEHLSFWGYELYEDAILEQAAHQEINVSDACERFGEIRLPAKHPDKDKYHYHPKLGIYSNIIETDDF